MLEKWADAAGWQVRIVRKFTERKYLVGCEQDPPATSLNINTCYSPTEALPSAATTTLQTNKDNRISSIEKDFEHNQSATTQQFQQVQQEVSSVEDLSRCPLRDAVGEQSQKL